MFQAIRNGKFVRIAIAGAAAVLIACAAGAGPAGASEEDDDPIDVKVFRKVMRGLGLKRGDEAKIEYHERSPLVVPPTRDLPPPEDPARAERDPAWPKDPDQASRRDVAKRKKQAIDWEQEGRPLTPSELNKTASAGGSQPPVAQTKSAEESARQSAPSELGFKGFNNLRSLFGFEPKEETGSFHREPSRTELTQPPPGYLTPSPDQPYGVSKDTSKPKAANPLDQAVGSAGTR